jgi:catechol 2,3-dioxygenase
MIRASEPDGAQGVPPPGGQRLQPATPGSYGLQPADAALPDGVRLGPVRLAVADLARSTAFYQKVLGLETAGRDGDRVVMGAPVASPGDGGERAAPRDGGSLLPLVELEEKPGVRPAPRRGRLGLFHFAVLLPDRGSLGRFAAHLSRARIPFGAGDHHVSEALYLSDPDGLGIEVYADRPRTTWRRVGRELVMGTNSVDLPNLLAESRGGSWDGAPAGTVMGHVHLHVGDLDGAAAFYASTLGFDRTVWSYPGALFFGAGGYHHHLGTNVWAGADATPPTPHEAQLVEWTLTLPDVASVELVAERLRRAGHEVRERPGGSAVEVTDPWGTRLVLAS